MAEKSDPDRAGGLLAALPLWLLPNAEFGGADGQAEEVILELQPRL